MRTALVLLFLLAVASVPGSLLPQRPITQTGVSQYYADHPDLAPILGRLGMFDVFASPWFAAVYLLLFTSLVGCLVPRTWAHLRALRAAPPAPPRRLERLPQFATIELPVPPGEVGRVLDDVRAGLQKARYRVRRHGDALSADHGRFKETGNIIFHVALIGVLASLAVGKLWGFEGSVLVVEGQGFCNNYQQYDNYTAGPLVGELTPLCVQLDDFQARYEDDLTPASFTGDITYSRPPGGADQQTRIGVNDPLRLDGNRLYITGRGFAPTFDVRLPDGTTFTDLIVPFLPTDTATFASEGVLKLPDLGPNLPDLAVQGFFVPTATDLGDGVLASADPRPFDPAIALIVYEGSIGLDSGVPQNVFTLDQARIDRGQLQRIATGNLRPGESLTLGDGTAITFTGFRMFAAMQFNRDPGQVAVLVSVTVMLAGLLLTLLVQRRRVFVRVTGSADPDPHDADRSAGETVTVQIGGLTRGQADPERFARLVDRLRTTLAQLPADVPPTRTADDEGRDA